MSSHASTQDKSPDPGQALNVERKKTKVLKQALKQERKERVTLEQEFEKQKEQITDLNTQLQDKVSSQRVYFLGIFIHINRQLLLDFICCLRIAPQYLILSFCPTL